MRNIKLIVTIVMFLGTSLFAEMQDRWKIDLGGMFVTDFQTDMQLGKKGVPIGAKINTEDQLGLDNDTGAFRLDARYRFTDVHSMDISYFSVKSDGNKFVENEFEWNGDTLSDVQVKSYFDMDIYKVNYGYSFYHNEDIELMLTAGLHVTKLDLGLAADGNVNGEADTLVSSGSSVTAPLPVFGFKGEYTVIQDTLFLNYKVEYFYMKYDIYKGSFISSMLNLEYRFMENMGLGVGFNSNTLGVEMDDGDKKVTIENQLSGITAYLSFLF